MDGPHLVHSSIDVYLDGFPIFGITKIAAVNVSVQMLV